MVFLDKSLEILVDFDQKTDFFAFVFAFDDFFDNAVEDLPSFELSPAEFLCFKQFRLAAEDVVVFEVVEFLAEYFFFDELVFLDLLLDFEMAFVQKSMDFSLFSAIH